MPKEKNAFVRYKVLDRCFRDRSRRYYMADLVERVNKDMLYYTGNDVVERTVREDIRYMSDSKGFSAPIERRMDGHKVRTSEHVQSVRTVKSVS